MLVLALRTSMVTREPSTLTESRAMEYGEEPSWYVCRGGQEEKKGKEERRRGGERMSEEEGGGGGRKKQE